MSIEQVVEKTAHNPAIRYKINESGYLREGYFADLVLIDPKQTTLSSNETTRYQCRWTPFDGHQFSQKIMGTWVNGQQVFDGSQLIDTISPAMRLSFNY